jgi:predicted transcriptional regulator
MESEDLKTLTADITAAFVSNNVVGISDLPGLITSVHAALSGLGATDAPQPEAITPAVSIRASVKPDSLTCLECGEKFKTLRRHLASAHDLDEADYRQRFELPNSYPMVAPSYSEKRSAMAKQIGLGAKGRGGGRKAGVAKKASVR